MIDDNPLWQPALKAQLFQHTNHAQRWQRRIHMDGRDRPVVAPFCELSQA